jgi:hypothetical protein
MLPSVETCKRWRQRKFVRQPHRMVIGLIVSIAATVYALFSDQPDAARLFGAIAMFFLLMYALANYIVWKAEQPE